MLLIYIYDTATTNENSYLVVIILIKIDLPPKVKKYNVHKAIMSAWLAIHAHQLCPTAPEVQMEYQAFDWLVNSSVQR